MNYLSAWLFSFGIGTASLHSDLNKYPLSQPGFVTEFSVWSCFDKQLLGLKINYQNIKVHSADWARANFLNSEDNFKISKGSVGFFIGGELEPLAKIGNFTSCLGLSYMEKVGFGINASINWRIPNRAKNPKFYYYSKFDLDYWGSDLLDNYLDSGNGFGDFSFSLVLGIQIPIYLNNRHRNNRLLVRN